VQDLVEWSTTIMLDYTLVYTLVYTLDCTLDYTWDPYREI